MFLKFEWYDLDGWLGMKPRISIAAVLLAGIFLLANVYVVHAQWPAIKESGYAVTTNFHGLDILIGSNVTATAGTTDLGVTKVEFRWHDPSDNVVFDKNVSVSGPIITPNVPPSPIPDEITDWATSNPGVEYLYAQSWFIPNTVGDWGVQAIFYNATHARSNHTIRIRATSFMAIPEVPFGTIAILLSMFGALSVFVIKKKKAFVPKR